MHPSNAKHEQSAGYIYIYISLEIVIARFIKFFFLKWPVSCLLSTLQLMPGWKGFFFIIIINWKGIVSESRDHELIWRENSSQILFVGATVFEVLVFPNNIRWRDLLESPFMTIELIWRENRSLTPFYYHP